MELIAHTPRRASRSCRVEGHSHRSLRSPRNLARLRSSLQSGGVLTRALFDALDADGDRSLTAAEIDRGVRSLLGDGREDFPIEVVQVWGFHLRW